MFRKRLLHIVSLYLEFRYCYLDMFYLLFSCIRFVVFVYRLVNKVDHYIIYVHTVVQSAFINNYRASLFMLFKFMRNAIHTLSFPPFCPSGLLVNNFDFSTNFGEFKPTTLHLTTHSTYIMTSKEMSVKIKRTFFFESGHP